MKRGLLFAVLLMLVACAPQPGPAGTCTVTHVQSDQLELGMSVAEAFAVMGCEGQRLYPDRSVINENTVAVYHWRGANDGIGHQSIEVDAQGRVIAFRSFFLP